jgi:hypothetical protein
MVATTWLWLAIGAGVIAVLYGVFSMMAILKLPAGNARMQDIAAAIQAGAQAYLNRQYTTISIVGVVLFVIMGFALYCQRLERERRRNAPAPYLDVRGSVRTVGHRRVQQVRQSRQKFVELFAERRETGFALAEPLAERADLAFQRFDVAAGGFGVANCFRALVAGLAQAFDAHLQLFALGFQREISVAIELEAAPREIRSHGVKILAQALGIQHRASLANVARRAGTNRQ